MCVCTCVRKLTAIKSASHEVYLKREKDLLFYKITEAESTLSGMYVKKRKD